MAVSTDYFQAWGVEEIVRRRGAEWYKQGVDKEICIEIFSTCRFSDMQLLSWSKLQALLRDEKREIRENLDPSLAERREVREEVKEKEEREKYRIEYRKEVLQTLISFRKDREECKRKIRIIRRDGVIKEARPGDACFCCGKDIEQGAKCLGKRERFGVSALTLCMECVRADQKAFKGEIERALIPAQRLSTPRPPAQRLSTPKPPAQKPPEPKLPEYKGSFMDRLHARKVTLSKKVLSEWVKGGEKNKNEKCKG